MKQYLENHQFWRNRLRDTTKNKKILMGFQQLVLLKTGQILRNIKKKSDSSDQASTIKIYVQVCKLFESMVHETFFNTQLSIVSMDFFLNAQLTRTWSLTRSILQRQWTNPGLSGIYRSY